MVKASAEVNFGDLGMYVAGGGIPEGKYALEFTIQYEPASEKYTPKVARLGAMITAYPLEGGEPKHKFIAFGSKAHESFAPNADTGKGLVPLAGGAGAQTLAQSSNWGLFLKSMYDAGLPIGIFTNDISVLDGVHVQLTNIPEPEERKGFRNNQAKTAEVSGEDNGPKGGGTIPAVSEIIGLNEGGTPWEGGGGIPEPEAAKPAAKAPIKPGTKAVAPAKVAAKAPVKAGAKAAAPAVAEVTDEGMMEAAVNGVTAVLEKNPDGCGKLILRTGTFKAVQAAAGDDMAQAVLDNFFSSDDNLNSVLEQLGYSVQGTKIGLAQ